MENNQEKQNKDDSILGKEREREGGREGGREREREREREKLVNCVKIVLCRQCPMYFP